MNKYSNTVTHIGLVPSCVEIEGIKNSVEGEGIAMTYPGEKKCWVVSAE